MITVDDALFCVLHSCVDDLESSRLVYYIYLFQLSKLDIKFKFRLNSSGLVCRNLDELLDELINQDKIKVVNNVLTLTDMGYLYYDNIALTLEDWEQLIHIKRLLDGLSESELFFICVTDMIVFDVLRKYGTSGLVEQRSNIESSVASLSSEYSRENFDTALGIIRNIKEGF